MGGKVAHGCQRCMAAQLSYESKYKKNIRKGFVPLLFISQSLLCHYDKLIESMPNWSLYKAVKSAAEITCYNRNYNYVHSHYLQFTTLILTHDCS